MKNLFSRKVPEINLVIADKIVVNGTLYLIVGWTVTSGGYLTAEFEDEAMHRERMAIYPFNAVAS